MKYLPLLWRNLWRRKVRTIFTFLSVVVAFLLFGVLMAIRNGFEAGIDLAGQNRLLTIHKVSIIQQLPERYLAAIRSTPGVRTVTHLSWFGGVYQDPKQFFAQMAVDPETLLRVYPEYLLPEEQKAAWLKTRTGAIAGRKLAERYGWKIGDRIPIRPTYYRPTDGKPETYEFDLVGIYDGKTVDVDETGFFFHHDYLMERVGDPGTVGWYVLEVDDPKRADEIARAIDAQFANSPDETKTTTEKALAQSFAHQIGDTGAMLSAIAAIVFFVILLIAGNTMAQSIRERIPELAMLKTLGFSDGVVTALVLGEAALLLALGGGVGMATAVSLMPMLNGATGGRFPPLFIAAETWLLAGALVLGLAIVVGLPPALRVRRLRIVDALAGHR